MSVMRGMVYAMKILPFLLIETLLTVCLAIKPCFEPVKVQGLTCCPKESRFFPFLENSVTRLVTVEDRYCVFG